MRLTDLDPRWIGISGKHLIWERRSQDVRFGLTFRCPHCDGRLAVLFKPFIDPDDLARLIQWALPGAPDPNTGAAREVRWWGRAGETFSDLTLSPSINAEGHWHGFITAGEIVGGL